MRRSERISDRAPCVDTSRHVLECSSGQSEGHRARATVATTSSALSVVVTALSQRKEPASCVPGCPSISVNVPPTAGESPPNPSDRNSGGTPRRPLIFFGFEGPGPAAARSGQPDNILNRNKMSRVGGRNLVSLRDVSDRPTKSALVRRFRGSSDDVVHAGANSRIVPRRRHSTAQADSARLVRGNDRRNR